MSENSSSFLAKSTIKSEDREHRRKINFNIAKSIIFNCNRTPL